MQDDFPKLCGYINEVILSLKIKKIYWQKSNSENAITVVWN
jgi:hypothetical protein